MDIGELCVRLTGIESAARLARESACSMLMHQQQSAAPRIELASDAVLHRMNGHVPSQAGQHAKAAAQLDAVMRANVAATISMAASLGAVLANGGADGEGQDAEHGDSGDGQGE
jgi:hypothetical protein